MSKTQQLETKPPPPKKPAPQKVDGPDPNAQPDNIALPQPLAAKGDLVLNGASVVDGAVKMLKCRRVVITSAGDDRGVNWTVTGTGKADGPVITDTFAGANAADARSSQDFLTVTQVSGSGPAADTVSVGVGALPPQFVPLNEDAVSAVAMAMAQAHHGPDAAEAGAHYTQLARSIVAALSGLHDFEGNLTKPVEPEPKDEPAVLDDEDPVQVPVKAQAVPEQGPAPGQAQITPKPIPAPVG
jgi:hypothetical protein